VYVRKKKNATGAEYYQLVEAQRVDGKPRQKVLAHLGKYPTLEAALKGLPEDIKFLTMSGAAKTRARREAQLAKLQTLSS
jgi:hypothetical protein